KRASLLRGRACGELSREVMYGFPVVPVETGGLPGLFTGSETGFGRFLRGRRIGGSGSRIRRLGEGWCRGRGRRRSGEKLFFPLYLTPTTDKSVCLDDGRQQERDREEERAGLEGAECTGEMDRVAAEGGEHPGDG